MTRLFRLLILITFVTALALPGGVQAARPAAPAGPLAIPPAGYVDGQIQYSTILNCVSIIQGQPYAEYGVGTYVGFFADPNSGIPAVNNTYYVRVVVGGLGNSCSGMRAYIDLALPANTSLAIDAVNPVICMYDNAAIPAVECPQSLPASSYHNGTYALWSTDTAHARTWPIPQGHILEIRIPVRSSTALSASSLSAYVWALDGNSSPWLNPSEGVYVFSTQPSVVYPSPSTTGIVSTTAHSISYLYTNAAGTGYFDLGTSPGFGMIHEAVAIPSAGSWMVWDDWGPPSLAPDTLYYWRFTFTPNGGPTYFGITQTFRTLPDGLNTVGSGSLGSCTEAAFNTALSGAKKVAFNCGTQPVTITLTAAKTISSNVEIDGGNLVTLAYSGSGNHFNVVSGGNLTLRNMTLSNGNHTTACGGAVNIAAGGTMVADGVRFLSNKSNSQGGAICNNGNLTVSNSLFLNNSTPSHGGAIGNYGPLTITNSRFSANTSSANGGAIDNTNTITINGATFSGNSAAWRGGGINTYVGNLTIFTTTFDANTAGMYGGGVSSDSSTTFVSRSTFSNNVSSGPGGGLEVGGNGFLTLTNVTLSANHATTDGGGLFWYPGATIMATIINTTFGGNIAGGQGGNLYAGGAANPSINLQNTLLAAGSPNNCDHAITSAGYNLESANTCGLNAAGDQINQNPKLGGLTSWNSAVVATMPLLATSPAIDAGTGANCPAMDARGIARPQDGDRNGSAVCDIGSFEVTTALGFYYIPISKR